MMNVGTVPADLSNDKCEMKGLRGWVDHGGEGAGKSIRVNNLVPRTLLTSTRLGSRRRELIWDKLVSCTCQFKRPVRQP